MNRENRRDIEMQTVKDCPLLYKMRYRPMTETCMCWGWEFGHGWDHMIQETSCILEELNAYFYPRYRIRIQADQIKQKFGTLRFYYSIVQDHGKLVSFAMQFLRSFAERLQKNIDFKMKKVVDVEPFDYDDISEVTEDEFSKQKDKKISNVEFKRDGEKILKIIHLRDYGQFHYVPTAHILRHKISQILLKLEYWTDSFFGFSDSPAIEKAKIALDHLAEIIVRDAEDRCYRVCEDCGIMIGTDWSPRCYTSRYIQYLCDKCAEKTGRRYYREGVSDENGKDEDNGQQ